MSGYLGVFHLDGAPVELSWLQTAASFLSFRGPDRSEVRISGNIGFCHTLLRTSSETDGCPQIFSLDGNAWISGDVRIDGREALIAKLAAAPGNLKNTRSAELVLHAYAAWGEGCVEHLLGDFSFVIWDSWQRRVFAARDHLGIKPFYYARIGQCLIVSNTLDCIRRIPVVPDEQNEQAIGDYLLIGENKNPTTTFFSAIHTLPPAHRLIADPNCFRAERYWTMPIDEPLYYKHKTDYPDQFRELIRAAVQDRLPDGTLGILMSGGLDSPTLAVTAVQLGADVTAFTAVSDGLIPDQERHYAGIVAKHLDVPIHFIARDNEPFGWEHGSAPIHTPEPCREPMGLLASRQYHQNLAAHARVLFYGDGADDALTYEWKPYFDYLIRHRRWGRLFKDVVSELSAQPRIPILHRLLRSWRPKPDPAFYEYAFPSWINEDFTNQLKLRDRWQQLQSLPPSPHPIRPVAFMPFTQDFPFIAGWDPGFSQAPAEFRHPFWDLRVQRFLMAIPALPWCRNKYLIRTALRGLLPETVRMRPKTPVAGLPYLLRASRVERPVLAAVPAILQFVDTSKLPPWPGHDRGELDEILRVLGLQYWILGL